jgi:hypothetical protein
MIVCDAFLAHERANFSTRRRLNIEQVELHWIAVGGF